MPPKAEKSRRKVKATTQENELNKRIPSPYLIYCVAMRAQVKAAHPSASFSDIGRILGGMWLNLDEKAKAPYVMEAAAQKVRVANMREAVKEYERLQQVELMTANKGILGVEEMEPPYAQLDAMDQGIRVQHHHHQPQQYQHQHHQQQQQQYSEYQHHQPSSHPPIMPHQQLHGGVNHGGHHSSMIELQHQQQHQLQHQHQHQHVYDYANYRDGGDEDFLGATAGVLIGNEEEGERDIRGGGRGREGSGAGSGNSNVRGSGSIRNSGVDSSTSQETSFRERSLDETVMPSLN